VETAAGGSSETGCSTSSTSSSRPSESRRGDRCARSFNLAGTAALQLRFEVLNALNHPNFANPGNNISDAGTFGFITQTTGVGERNIRLGARFIF
jgi:hypothetical protein